jgi:hypothetical protein
VFLATTKVEDFDRWWSVFSTTSLEKRKQHGSTGSHAFRDPNEEGRVWVLFDWDADGWQSFVSDPEVPVGYARSDSLISRSSCARSTADGSSSPRALPEELDIRSGGTTRSHNELTLESGPSVVRVTMAEREPGDDLHEGSQAFAGAGGAEAA